MAKIRNVEGAHFLTLTCSDVTWAGFGADDQRGMANYVKSKLHALEKRLAARFPGVGGFWRLEFVRRKSGALTGRLVPHLHLLAFGIMGVKLLLLQMWLSRAWFEVVASGDPNHLSAGTNCRQLASRRHAAAYVSKYVGKEESDTLAAGRRWGVFGALDRTAGVVVELTLDQWVQFKRLVRGWLKSRGSRFAPVVAAMPAEFGMSVLGLGDQSLADHRSSSPTILRMLQAVTGKEMGGAVVASRGDWDAE